MSLLTASDLTSMRSVLNESLPGTAILMARTQAGDGQGGYTDTYAASGTVACRLSPLPVVSGIEEPVGDRKATIAERVITLPAETSVPTTGRIQIGAETFQVTSVRAPRTWELSVRVHAYEIT